VVGRNPQLHEIEQGIVRGCPLGLVKTASPVPTSLTMGQELRTPSFCRNPLPQARFLDSQQVPLGLVLDGDVAFQEPIDDIILHVHDNFGHCSQISLKLRQIRAIATIRPLLCKAPYICTFLRIKPFHICE
jgi:hypothetical protein